MESKFYSQSDCRLSVLSWQDLNCNHLHTEVKYPSNPSDFWIDPSMTQVYLSGFEEEYVGTRIDYPYKMMNRNQLTKWRSPLHETLSQCTIFPASTNWLSFVFDSAFLGGGGRSWLLFHWVSDGTRLEATKRWERLEATVRYLHFFPSLYFFATPTCFTFRWIPSI